MNDFQTQIYKTIDILTEQKLKSLGFDISKRGKVISVNSNVAIVQIDGEEFTCKLRRGINVIPNDIVYVKFPQNNESDKYIETILGINEIAETIDITAEEILSKLLTVDGATSGLDADLLDGKHASEFALVNDLGNIDLSGEKLVANINLSTAIIDDKNLSLNVADAIAKKHSHINSTILDAMEVAFTTALKTKIDNIFDGATKVEDSITNGNIKINGVESVVYTHPNHTGDVTSTADGATVIGSGKVTNAKLVSMPINTIKGVQTAGVPTDLTATQVKTILDLTNVTNVAQLPLSQKGAVSGVAELDANGKVPTTQLPIQTIYETANTNIQTHIASSANPHVVTKTDVGLGSVDDTSDISKNVLSATKLTTARTINGISFDGTANIIVADSTKEPSFAKNTGFNKAFGTTAGTVVQGDDSRLSDARTPLAHNHDASNINAGVLVDARIPNLNMSKITAGNLDTIRLSEPAFVTASITRTARPLFDVLRADRTAFLPATQIIIERSTDAGVTWQDHQVSDINKAMLFTGQRPSISIPLIGGLKNTACMIRITITGMRYNVPPLTPEVNRYSFWGSSFVQSTERYFAPTEGWTWVSSNSDRIHCRIERATGISPNIWSLDREAFMSGWSGGNYFSLSGSTFGGGTTQTTNTWNWRFTFRTATTSNDFDNAKLSTTYTTSAQSIHHIKISGVNVWSNSNNLMYNDHLYSWDYLQNATFPAEVKATTFKNSSNVEAVYTNDTRLSDARTPLAHNHTKANITDFAHSHLIADLPPYPTALPADGGTADTLTGLVPTITELNYVDGVTSAIQGQIDLKAPTASPSFTGIPLAPTPIAGTNTTQIATTAFVQSAITGAGSLVLGETSDTAYRGDRGKIAYDYSQIGHEPSFTKNTAFNKNFGTTSGTVTQGNDTRLSDARTPLAHDQAISTITNLQTELNGKEAKIYIGTVEPTNQSSWIDTSL